MYDKTLVCKTPNIDDGKDFLKDYLKEE